MDNQQLRSSSSSSAAVAATLDDDKNEPNSPNSNNQDIRDDMSSPLFQADPFDYHESLDLSFDDIASLDEKVVATEVDDELLYPTCKKLDAQVEESYILGTLIVRVVAARNLASVDSPGLLGGIFFGGGGAGGGGGRNSGSFRSSSRSSGVNAYASVRFGSTTQRTSQVFGTTDPIWPRTEAMYMDVTHPPPQESTSTTTGGGETSASRRPAASISNDGAPLEWSIDPPVLTVGIFHSSSDISLKKQKNMSGDSNDTFLGMVIVNLTHLLTGKSRFDEWLPLTGGISNNNISNNRQLQRQGSSSLSLVRLVCEYEPSDPSPHQGDIVQFTRFCRPADLYPLSPFGTYVVAEGPSNHDLVLIQHTSREGWVSSFLAHRFMLLVVERHYGAMDLCQDEMLSIAQRLSHSPLMNVVQESLGKIDDEGLVSVGAVVAQEGWSLLNRWFQGGCETVVQDLAYATNWDGRFNPDPETSLSTGDETSSSSNNSPASAGDAATPPLMQQEVEDESSLIRSSTRDDTAVKQLPPLLPNMPSCPITQEPMRDPVVAADGHTYERSAIVRWLQTSDKSPLTGSVLPHKNLVPNYMLLSSLQEAAAAAAAANKDEPVVVDVRTVYASDDDLEETTEVQID